jgi:hypothetical protein
MQLTDAYTPQCCGVVVSLWFSLLLCLPLRKSDVISNAVVVGWGSGPWGQHKSDTEEVSEARTLGRG